MANVWNFTQVIVQKTPFSSMIWNKIEISSLLETRINERSFVKLYERTKTAITQPMYIASFLPGSVFLEVRREMTSDFWIKNLSWLTQPKNVQDIIELAHPVRQRVTGSKLLLCLSRPGYLEYCRFLSDFELNFSSRIAVTSFIKISIPLKMFWACKIKRHKIVTCLLKHRCWHRFASFS